ncbi:uncharacterized protein LOC130980645 [Arachis stenosperma]|uniref:uncharacterized protein LOC130980645 n=1 Tax=Arachis stenosperma TaxID=217475 RepID=UPI0025AD3EB3|nr:uncharacterized protein LOC130980645 [Arachis stenosperma]
MSELIMIMPKVHMLVVDIFDISMVVSLFLFVIVVLIKRPDQDSTIYQLAFHVGLKGHYSGSNEKKYFIHNHLKFTVKYHRDLLIESARIVGFQVKPFSICHVLSEDVLYSQRKCMQCEEKKLQANGRSLKEYDQMPLPTLDVIDGLDDRMLMDELNFDLSSLKDETLSAAIRSEGHIVLNVTSSGIASLLLPNGRTAHFRFKIPLDINEDSICCIKQGSLLARLVFKAKLIIWDEAPMLNKLCYESLDKCLHDILRFESYYNADLPFTGKVVVLGGDFRQILPVIPIGPRQEIVHASINSSYLWRFCQVLTLTENMRLTMGTNVSEVSMIKEFANWLLKIGDGLVGDSTEGESEVEIPKEMLIRDSADAFCELMIFVYPKLLSNINRMGYFKER